MFHVFEVAHGDGDSLPEFRRPAQTTRHLGHVFMSHHSPVIALMLHVGIVDLFSHIQLMFHHCDYLGIVGVEVILDKGTLQE